MNAINSKKGATYHMEAPEIEADHGKTVKTVFPVYEAVTPTAGLTLTLAPEASNLNVGAKVVVVWTSDGTARNVTVKVGEDTVATLSGTASTKVVKQLMWDGEGLLAL